MITNTIEAGYLLGRGRREEADQRIQRALEICRLSGRPMSELLAASEQQAPPADFLSLGLLPSVRAPLHERIAALARLSLDPAAAQ